MWLVQVWRNLYFQFVSLLISVLIQVPVLCEYPEHVSDNSFPIPYPFEKPHDPYGG